MEHPNARNNLQHKKILLGITGGIAAYKCAELVRLLKKSGAEVRVVMTAPAQQFIAPLTFQALSGNPVHTELLDVHAEAGMGHIKLARWADLVVIAPATASFLALLTGGHANELLTTLCLATTAPIVVVPAMNQQMWANPATQENILKLRQRGIRQIGPEAGEQACGETGLGRMSEPEQIVSAISEHFSSDLRGILDGVRVVITAGPTREAIDPVRFLTNRSSGKMGFAIAQAAAEAGAEVALISGVVALETPQQFKRIDVESALEMQAAVTAEIENHGCDLFIATAAVADYRPVIAETQKIKKAAVGSNTSDKSDILTLELQRNPDILAEVAARENPPFTVGFAAETENLAEYAQQKLAAKKIDLIAANQVGKGLGFEADENAIRLFWKDGEKNEALDLGFGSKQKLAQKLIEVVAEQLRHSQKSGKNLDKS